MKKFIFSMIALFAMVSTSLAEDKDKFVFGNAYVPQGGSATVAVSLISAERLYGGFQFDVKLPKGISVTGVIKAARLNNVIADDNLMVALTDEENNVYNVLGFNSARKEIPGEDGDILYLVLTADATVAIGEYTAEVTGGKMSTIEAEGYKSPDATFPIKVTVRLVLDETSSALPAASDGEVNVTVIRKVNANEWGTLCLPFDMSAEQITAVFGEKTQFALFNNYTKDGGNASTKQTFTATNIVLNFEEYDWSEDGIYANVPYLMKSVNSVESFDLDGVTIDPDEESAKNEYKRSGKVVGTMFGTLHAGKYIQEYGLFLNSGKFYYSKGKTKIKAFRGYFVLNDVLADLSSASVKVNVDGEATSIDGMHIQYATEGVYDLSGRKIQLQDGDLNKLQKGVYIIDGKKVTIK